MIDIIIPTFNQEDFTIRCIDSIKKYTSDYRIIWVDNGSNKESREKVIDKLLMHDNYKTIWLDKNYGFVKAVNIGIKASDSEFVVLQNNDTVVTPMWLNRLKEPMNNDKHVMITGPLTDTVGSWQGWRNVKKKMLFDMDDLDDKYGEEISDILINKYKNKFVPVKMLAFFSVLIRRSIIDKIGILDEDYGIGFGDDDDFSCRVLREGGKLIFVPSSFVFHYHRTTFKSLYSDNQISQMQSNNMNLFKKKNKLI